MRDITSGQAAKACGVAPRTISKWIDSGMLPGYRLPGCQDRRVQISDFVLFIQRNGLPISWLDYLAATILVVTCDELLMQRVREKFHVADRWLVLQARDVYNAGKCMSRLPAVAVVDSSVGRQEAIRLAHCIRSEERIEVAYIAADDETVAGAPFPVYRSPVNYPALFAQLQSCFRMPSNEHVFADRKFRRSSRVPGRKTSGEAASGGAPAPASASGPLAS